MDDNAGTDAQGVCLWNESNREELGRVQESSAATITLGSLNLNSCQFSRETRASSQKDTQRERMLLKYV